ncbi:penicillinase repressor [Pseudoalteromonas porphyrae]|uniref:Penicillinase repressor n=1 Tax=Pseudoalteromonas porphyrae TaxID=187330 RepID=A0A0N1EMJ1_9GAMM|nr:MULTISPECIES: BlaI/MecI/CopY family transcriptional regulator [Pseudoalteromonas]KPH64344.1 penicillinase repressor [Pseudoalteromonas porphyrae]KPH96176.1 penicillinase repressor [Pseudoalteromonas porphyrae]NMR24133.1 BlaI/MecI/CopY family transcriptional regulator [Pseudoalteromonas sp. NEC-BIFX-2020_015]NNG43049.1 BlaI/MecI/CopY family transcriptional regulator [Pseudoalteromonas sp. NEC-BIFX-2020_002]
MQPTAPELEILKQLWYKQPRTARELHDHIAPLYDWSYSSTRKTLERMGEKKFIYSEAQGNKRIYFAKLDKMTTLARITKDFATRVLELDGPLPIAMFADSKLISNTEIDDLEKLLNDLQQPVKGE